jgi:ATP-dependent helicase/nuclease subunit A
VVLADFITAMEERILSESRHEQAAVAGETDNVVRLMTIHKAKGLEFPVVFIPDLNWSAQGSRRRLLLRSDWGLLYRPPDDNGLREEPPDRRDETETAEKPLSWRLASALEDQDQRKEDIRKLYVAATRAKDHLAIVAADWRGQNGQFQRGDCLIRRIDAVLGIGQAADQRRDSIPYDGGRYSLRLCVLSPSSASGREKSTPARVILSEAKSADDVAEGLARLAGSAPPPPLLADLPESADRAELAVTAISDFAFCPMLYRWQYELRVSAPPARDRAAPPESISSAALGSILHRCMELLDFASPAPPETLVRRALAEAHPGGLDDAAPIAAQLEDMLARLRRGPLWPVLTTAKRTYRELDFALAVGRGVLHGKIDLLLEDSAGGWTIVDYKSDRVGPEGVAGHAQRYELQVLAYALAAARYLDQPPAQAVLYFLRPAEAHSLNITQETLLSAQRRLETLVGEILSAGRSGRYVPKDAARCQSCPYGPLCRPA